MLKLGAGEAASIVAKVLDGLDFARPELAAVWAAAGEEAAAARALLEYFRARTSFKHPVDRAQCLESRGKYADEKELKIAEEATRNILIASLWYPPHDFGEKIAWDRNPIKDSEWLWQLHRMYSWQALARAYAHTGDEKYAQAWARQFLDWVKHNLLDARPAYAWRTIEAGIRGNGWINLYGYFAGSEAFTPEVCAAFAAACLEHARYLDAALSKKPHGNNWRLMEAEGLGAIALCFPEFKDAAAWRTRSFSVLKDNLKHQVFGDGMHVERCFNYHQLCIGLFARTAQLARKNGYEAEFGEDYFKTIEAMCAALLKMSFPDGAMAQFGDVHSHLDIRGTLRGWADFFKREDFQYVGSAGKQGAAPKETSFALMESGFYAMRTGWDAAATCLIFKCGPDGGFHDQPDNGTFELFAGGRRLTPDSGCYLYHGDVAGRNWFRQTRVHQTLTLDGKNSEHGPRLRLWKPGQGLDALVVENAGYKGLIHRRAVLFVKPAFIVLVDEALGGAAGELRVHFQFAPGDARIEPLSLRARTGFASGTNLLVAAMPSEGLALVSEEGWVSFKYASREARPAFALATKKDAATKAVRFVTVLALHEAEPPSIAIKPLGEAEPGWIRAEFEITIDQHALRVGYDLERQDAWR